MRMRAVGDLKSAAVYYVSEEKHFVETTNTINKDRRHSHDK
jgi:hypothetical protein